MKSIVKAFSVLGKKNIGSLLFVLIQIVVGSILEMFGVTAILPLISLAVNPNKIYENDFLYGISKYVRFSDSYSYFVFLSIMLIFIYFVKNMYVIWMNNNIYRFAYKNQKELACRLLTSYLRQPYSFFVNHNSADFIRNLNEDTIYFFETVIASLQFAAEIMVCAMLGITLLVMDTTLTLGMIIILLLFFLIVFRKLKRNLEKKGTRCRGYRAEMNKWILQATGGIKETKILEKEQFFIEKYEGLYNYFAEDYRRYKMYAFLPRPLMESVSVCALLLIVVIKIINGADMTVFVPILSVFAVAVFRMLPSFNRLATYVSQIMFNKASVEAIYNDLKEFETEEEFPIEEKIKDIPFNNEIRLKDICFRYPDAEEDVVSDVELVIPKGKSVAFIGASGAGKTTLADIILGVLSAQKGNILVDGQPIDAMSREWHKKVGYIPQTIFLMDDTVRNNIAFGIESSKINESQLEKAIDGAQLKEFIDSLPEGLNTEIGERGVRLSGGQRQRIGIARALYFNPEILVLDEATSALDNDTESAVMEAIDNLAGTKTLLIIAHRLTTIKNCDIVYEIKDKKVGISRNEQ